MNRERTCITCREHAQKSAFVRIVRTPDGHVQLDRSGKANGRGAYVCSEPCLQVALQKGKVAHALKCSISKEVQDQLALEYKKMAQEVTAERKES